MSDDQNASEDPHMSFRELMAAGSIDRPAPEIVARVAEVARLMKNEGRSPSEAMALTEPAPVWNVRIAVVMCLRAKDGPSAIAAFDRSLRKAGFDTLTEGGGEYADAFRAEDGTEPSDLPA